MSRLVDVNKLKEALIKEYLRGKKTLMEVIDEQPTVKMKDSQNDIANIIYNALDHMYCDECHRKYNGWGVSMQESNRIAKEILKQLGE